MIKMKGHMQVKNKYAFNEQGETIQTPFTLFSKWADTVSDCLIGLDCICEKYNAWLRENGYSEDKERDIRLYLEYAGYKQVKAYDLSTREDSDDLG